MRIPTMTPDEVKRRVENGTAIVVDIREPMEHARESIPGAQLNSLSNFNPTTYIAPGAPATIFHCQSGKRTADNAEQLLNCGASEAYLMQGGLSGWKAAGHLTVINRDKPIEMQRQVQIAAGVIVLLSVLLAWWVSVFFLTLTAFVGGGLVFAGVSGWCGMAKILNAMPWNRAQS